MSLELEAMKRVHRSDESHGCKEVLVHCHNKSRNEDGRLCNYDVVEVNEREEGNECNQYLADANNPDTKLEQKVQSILLCMVFFLYNVELRESN